MIKIRCVCVLDVACAAFTLAITELLKEVEFAFDEQYVHVQRL